MDGSDINYLVVGFKGIHTVPMSIVNKSKTIMRLEFEFTHNHIVVQHGSHNGDFAPQVFKYLLLTILFILLTIYKSQKLFIWHAL